MQAHPAAAETCAHSSWRRLLLALACLGAVSLAQAQTLEPVPQSQPAEPGPASPADEIGETGETLAPADIAPERPGMQAPAPAAGQGAGQVIETLHNALMHVMQHSQELGYAGRYRHIEPVVTSSFDTPLIVKVILSRYWEELDAGQQQQFIDLFRRLSIATYASRFHDYDGEEFVEIGREELKRERLLIKTELRRPSEKPVRLDYLMHRNGNGQWLIISVIANGVNDLSLKRAEYAAVIREKGYAGLLQDIQQKIAEMERSTGT